ncbi:hypothetical protein UPTC5083_01421 [Campylobacter lari]|uniref:hypothetical protein n=1 Tax=Campylobacter lari TaxID=201 RepID=UPI00127AA5F0|nr:hypothetical protein [Campylobacter lari]EAK0446450.1 hypothetical protein [Campylobacter lari]EGK8089010.1 hypothetical protein [Campylobacter lari]MCR6517547.1 hypothetical protein [Campylobacter lari]MCR6525473.1 hypothetical protein [Campylobacter lari]
MTPEKAKEIFVKVIKEKEELNITSINEKECKDSLHNGIDAEVSKFLKKYRSDKQKFKKEIELKQNEAQELLESINK